MHHDQYGQLLLDAIRETLETMAFAEIVPYSMGIGNKELVNHEELCATVNQDSMATQSDGNWGMSPKVISEEGAWGTAPTPQPPNPGVSDAWGTNTSPVTDRMWNNPLDAWQDNVSPPISEDSDVEKKQPVDFDKMMNEQDDWCWSCLKVNSPELDCIWLVVSKQLAQELARTMYAGDDFQLDKPALRDIIAELTNVLGGRLMLLLEEIVGKFTLEVPITGTGKPDLPDNTKIQTVTCKVFVDKIYPVMSMMCFKN